MSAEGREAAVSVGLDLGGTATRFVSLDHSGRVLRQLIESTPSDVPKASAVDFLVDRIAYLIDGEHLGSIGIAASGPIDGDGVIQNFETLAAFSDIDIVAALENHFDRRPTIHNDAVTAAIGEYRQGAGRGAHDMLMVTLGTGVGVCLLQQGEPFRGSNGQHPEASHLSVTGDPAPCYCGRERCWEQTASRKALQDGASALLDQPSGSSDDIDLVNTRALDGDRAALHMFADYGHTLADGLLHLISAYQPDRVVIGGSGSTYLASYGFAFRESLGRIQDLDPTIVVAAELGEYGGAVGAALAASA